MVNAGTDKHNDDRLRADVRAEAAHKAHTHSSEPKNNESRQRWGITAHFCNTAFQQAQPIGPTALVQMFKVTVVMETLTQVILQWPNTLALAHYWYPNVLSDNTVTTQKKDGREMH